MLEKQILLIVWGLLMVLLLPIHVLSCEKFPCVSKKEWESYPKWEGQYTNCDNGYAITIPGNFTARSTPPPAPQHGIGIWLSEDPSGYIGVDGSFNTLEWESLEQAVTWHIDRRHEDARELLSVQKFHIKLDTLPAIRCVIRYSCPDSTMMIDDYFLALDRGMV